MNHSFAALMDWTDGVLAPEHEAQISADVATADVTTQNTVRWMREFVDHAAQNPLFESPPIVTQRLHRIFDLRSQGASADSIVNSDPIEAQLFFDSRRDLVLENARGAHDSDVVHLAFACDAGDVVLDFTPAPDGSWGLDGQVLLNDETDLSAFEVSVHGPSGRIRSVDGTKTGEFALQGIAPDADRVTLDNGQFQIAADIRLSSIP